MSELCLGIDPGQSGGFGLVPMRHSCLQAQCFKFPDTERDIADMLESFRYLVNAAVIERVHSMPKQGVASSFKFGYSYGFLRGLLIASKIPFTDASPQQWQKEVGCLTRGNKNVSKFKAQQMWPMLKITHATADAMLIAEFCRKQHEV